MYIKCPRKWIKRISRPEIKLYIYDIERPCGPWLLFLTTRLIRGVLAIPASWDWHPFAPGEKITLVSRLQETLIFRDRPPLRTRIVSSEYIYITDRSKITVTAYTYTYIHVHVCKFLMDAWNSSRFCTRSTHDCISRRDGDDYDRNSKPQFGVTRQLWGNKK